MAHKSLVKIFLAQFQPILFDKQRNLQRMKEFIHQAAHQQADLVLFPELCLTGYFTRKQTASLSEGVNGPSIQQMSAWAGEYRIKVIFGFPENKEGSFYNSACFISETGKVLGTYQKIHLWDEESKYFSAGDSYPVWKTDIGNIAIMICYDTEFPETSRILALRGADMILAPTANMSPLEHFQEILIQCRAAENQCFVATTNRIGTEEANYFFGHSAAADPFGKLLWLADSEESGDMVEFDLKRIREARQFADYLRDRRPHLYGDLQKGALF